MSKLRIKTLFEDDDLIVLDKPSGILTLPDRFNKSLLSLKSYLEKKYHKIYPVHRLDKDTSGVILFTKNSNSHKLLSQQFDNNQIQKYYHAFVSGRLPEDISEIDIPLMPNPSKSGTMIPSVRGKNSLTLIKIIESFRISKLIECQLLTGRQHQIRVHLSAIGYPLLVDPIYGNSDVFYLSMIKRNYKLKKNTTETPLISRLTLHSFKLKFIHPVTNEEMEIQSEYPKDLKALRQILQKYSSIQ